MSSEKIVIESLAELKGEIPHLNPIGYSSREFSQESNNIQQAQANTIVKLSVKINVRGVVTPEWWDPWQAKIFKSPLDQ